MKRDLFNKIFTTFIFAVSIVLMWGGMIYATNDSDQLRGIGVIVSLIGYSICFWAVLRYENTSEEQD